MQLELFDTHEDDSVRVSVDPEIRVDISNRKFLGSKQNLLSFIERSILERVPVITTFCDSFAGTGVVAQRFRKHAPHVIVNDLLYSNYVVNRAFLGCTADSVSFDRVSHLLSVLNGASTQEDGYVFKNYGGTYFTYENAARIDTLREAIEQFYQQKECTEQEYFVLLTSLLFAVDKVANTVGQYDAFLKHIGEESYDENGKHVIDASVYKRLLLRFPDIELDGRCEVHNEDINILISRIKGDVLYIDPPYNTRQYIDCYHVLENILRWKKPPLHGKTRKFSRSHLKSRYSSKVGASEALAELVGLADFRHIFISYNNEGLIPKERIVAILEQRGTTEVLEEPYKIFGSGAGRSMKRPITEFLFYCKVTSEL